METAGTSLKNPMRVEEMRFPQPPEVVPDVNGSIHLRDATSGRYIARNVGCRTVVSSEPSESDVSALDAMAVEFGRVEFGKWTFEYVLNGVSQGLAVSFVDFNGRRIFRRMTLPIVRTRYHGEDGPIYRHRLDYDTALECPPPNPSHRRVCILADPSTPARWVQAYTYFSVVDNHWLWQAYQFNDDGTIYLRFGSTGYQHVAAHTHHPYWRLDSAIANPSGTVNDEVFDEVLEYNSDDFGDPRYGGGLRRFEVETSRTKNLETGRIWQVVDNSPGTPPQKQPGYLIAPKNGGYDEGTADFFSDRDLWVVRYHDDESGEQATAANDGLGNYVNGEALIDSGGTQNIIVWYAAHLFQTIPPNPNRSVGPSLFPANI